MELLFDNLQLRLGRYVGPVGPPRAKIAIVGEAPGQQEENEGMPFVGGSGQLLNQMLAAAGIQRTNCYVTNVMKYKPPGNDFGVFYHDTRRDKPTSLLETGIKQLHAELTTVKPNVILVLGAEALRAVTGKRGIDKWRGSILPSPFGKVVPTYHPAYILRVWGDKPVSQIDINRASKESQTKEIDLPKYDFVVNPSFSKVLDYIQKCKQSRRFAFDIETTGPHIRCLGLAPSTTETICIPFISRRSYINMVAGQTVIDPFNCAVTELTHTWSEPEEYEIVKALHDLFNTPGIQKVAQNSPYDVTVLQSEYGITIENHFMDTMVAFHTVYAEFRKGLDFLCSILTRTPYYSDYDSTNDTQTWIYNCYDAAVTLECSFVIESELKAHGLTDFYFNHVHPTLESIIKAQTRGVKVDVELRDKRKALALVQKEEYKKKVEGITKIEGFNPNSPLQMKNYLYTTLGLQTKYKGRGKDKTVTADENTLIELGRQYPEHKPFFEAILEYRGLAKLIGTYYDVPLSQKNRIHTSYNVAGTVTRRLSSSEFAYALGDLFPSTNLQNPPKGDFRQIFVADDGWTLLKADLSQAEFRIVCWLARIQRLINKYILDHPYVIEEAGHNAFDVHRWVAALIYSIMEEEVQKKQRDLAKNGVYGGNYGMEPPRASQVYKMDLQTAKFILGSYRKAVHEVPDWWLSVKRTIDQTRTILSSTGGKRIFFGRIDEELYRSAYSHSAQSIVSDLINRAFHLLEETLPENDCHILLQVHDELVFACRDSLVSKYVPIIASFMQYPLTFPGVKEPMIIPAEIKAGKNWYDMKQVWPIKLEKK